MILGWEWTVMEQGRSDTRLGMDSYGTWRMMQRLESTVMEQGRSGTRLGMDSYGTGKK